MTALLSAGNVYADTEAESSIQTEVQPTVSVVNQSVAQNPVVDASSGRFDGQLSAVFELNTNDTQCNFILTSQVERGTSTHSAFTNDGTGLLFAHTFANVEESAIADAKAKGSNNRNVIVYPFTLNINPSTFASEPVFGTYETYGDGFMINVNELGKATLTQSIIGTPVTGSYSVGQDEAGTYQSTVMVTVVNKQ